jgi:hypothetical protein
MFAKLLKIVHLSEFANHPQFKSVVNTIFLSFSCLLIVSSYTAGIQNWFTKICAILVLVTLDVAIQWVLGLGKAYWKAVHIKWHKIKGTILIFFWVLYVLVYAVPTAVGFFMNTLSIQEQQIQTTNTSYTIYKDEYDSNKITIDNLNAQYAVEAKTTKGKHSDALLESLEKYRIRQITLGELLQSSEKEKEKVSQTSDQTMKTIAEPFGLDEQFLTLVVYSITVIMIYLFLALTSWYVIIGSNQSNNNSRNESVLSDFQKRLLLFVDGLYRGRNGEGLNGVKVISENTGIPEDECKGLRDYLANLDIEGESAITVSQGVVSKNYSKKELVNYITTTHSLSLI